MGTAEHGRWLTPDRVLAGLALLFRVLSAPFVRYEIHGGRCATELRVGVIAANHRSMFDVIAGLVCLHHFKHYPRLLVERRYVERGLVGFCSRGIGAIPVDRDGNRSRALAAAWTALDEGIPILVMPEGGLHWDPDDPLSTGPARTGVSRLAAKGGYPVVPVALAGTERVVPPGRHFPRANPFRRKVVVCQVADEPLWLTGDDHRANTELVMAAIRDLLALAQPAVR
jgi:1-acyl-sn-glycerol-3-phosphate acyltransferase